MADGSPDTGRLVGRDGGAHRSNEGITGLVQSLRFECGTLRVWGISEEEMSYVNGSVRAELEQIAAYLLSDYLPTASQSPTNLALSINQITTQVELALFELVRAEATRLSTHATPDAADDQNIDKQPAVSTGG